MRFSNRIRQFAPACFVFFAFALSLATTENESQLTAADAAFHAGYAAEKNGDLSTARQQFEKVVRLAPNIAEGHIALGSVLVQTGEFKLAIRELTRALALKPGDRAAQTNLAVAYEQLGEHDKSLTVFRSLSRSQDRGARATLPSSIVIFYIRALAATRQTELAITEAQSAVAAAPGDPVLRDTLGSLEAQRQQWNDAEGQFKEAVRLNPTFAEAHLHFGLTLMMQQKIAAAVQELRTAAELSPQSATTQVDLAQSLIASGDNTSAIPVLQRALALDPSSRDAKYQIALAYQGSGEEPKAIPFFQQVLAADPNNAPALTNLGLALVQTGKAKEALPLYQRALRQTPDDPIVHQGLGVAYLQVSDLEDAIAEFRTGIKLAPEAYELHYDLGLALKLKDDLAAAASELDLAARLNPTSPDPPYTLGILEMQRGEFENSVKQLKIALKLRPANGDGWATLGSVYKQQNNLADASDALHKAIELIPNQPGPHITLAAVLSKQGRTEEAAAERKKAVDLSQTAVSRQRATFAANTGGALLLKGQITDAIERYEEAVSSDLTYIEGHRGLANALVRAGRTAEAQAEIQKAAELEQAQAKAQSH